MSNRIYIFGAGWLGIDVAYDFHSKGHEVCVFSRSEIKIESLRSRGIEAHKATFFNGKVSFAAAIVKGSTLLFCLPPSVQYYCETLLDIVATMQPSHIVFCSSIGIYASKEGWVDENCVTDTDSVLHKAEEKITGMNIPFAILRLGGLIGADRNPATYFSNKFDIPNGMAPVNLIHKMDVMSCIEGVIALKSTGIFNVVYPSHPSRKEYYEQKCLDLGLLPCSFQNLGVGKVVKGDEIMRVISDAYKHPI